MIVGIFESKLTDDHFFDYIDDYEIREVKYFVDEGSEAGHHASVRSALYDDMTGYVDVLQDEQDLPDGELYVVTYYKFDGSFCGLAQYVDFGITKEQIIENVKVQKYVEGANYFTMGQMFYTTKMVLESKYEQ